MPLLLACLLWFGLFGLVCLVWLVWFGLFGLDIFV